MKVKMNKTAEFDAVDADGNRYRILEFTPYKEVVVDGQLVRAAGVKALMLRNGDAVRLSDDGSFEIVSSGARLLRV